MGRLALAFPLSFAVWMMLAPLMTSIIVGIAEPIVYVLDWHDLTIDIVAQDCYFHVFTQAGGATPIVGDFRRISFNVIFLAALVLSVPDVRLKLRLKILVIGLGILFPLHVERVVVFILNNYGQHIQQHGQSIYPVVYRKFLFYLNRVQLPIDSMLTPVAIWFGLHFYYIWNRNFMMRDKKKGRLASPPHRR